MDIWLPTPHSSPCHAICVVLRGAESNRAEPSCSANTQPDSVNVQSYAVMCGKIGGQDTIMATQHCCFIVAFIVIIISGTWSSRLSVVAIV